ncbi:unnamed protein product [Penicillium salamii]|uniref:Uncharacterized protein n=1 Tax=Penicillium salamii TaxID=1612424 RepID=A0A9W4ISX0_9EURO|nr:unnamed protein product [Penicillium salamii]CAG8329444.1 unnamed protein product [Penicillium salamii]CAG8338221.1 unnamed protein product [Penicillium salamii]CAG8373121.1 unnamed protein product [Penicillium salamii]
MNYFLLCALDIATASGSKEEQLPKIDLEPKWSFGPVQYNDQAVKLTGYPYYALWHGEKDEAASNVIVTQGQGFGGSEEAIAEVLGYMGEYFMLLVVYATCFIHHHRKNAKKEIFPLYGIATDSRIFHFIKLDNDSTFVTATLDSETDLQKAFSLLVHILKEAVTALSMQPSELSTQSDRGEAPSDPSIPAGASLRRRVDKKAHYRILRATADDEDEDSESEDVDDEDLEDDSSDDSSEDETSEDNESQDK